MYPIMAAREAKRLEAVYLTTDSPELMDLARRAGVEVIQRPPELSHDAAELVDAIAHALDVIGPGVEILVTMHCNCAVHRPGLVDACIEKLLEDPEADSCVSGSIEQAAHPYRTRRLAPDGTLRTWMEAPAGASSNRQALEPCFILDGAARALRVARCFPPGGPAPFGYLGKRTLAVENPSRGDVHGVADVVVAEYYLQRLGWRPPGSGEGDRSG